MINRALIYRWKVQWKYFFSKLNRFVLTTVSALSLWQKNALHFVKKGGSRYLAQAAYWRLLPIEAGECEFSSPPGQMFVRSVVGCFLRIIKKLYLSMLWIVINISVINAHNASSTWLGARKCCVFFNVILYFAQTGRAWCFGGYSYTIICFLLMNNHLATNSLKESEDMALYLYY